MNIHISVTLKFNTQSDMLLLIVGPNRRITILMCIPASIPQILGRAYFSESKGERLRPLSKIDTSTVLLHVPLSS